jgi:hypothetical protein
VHRVVLASIAALAPLAMATGAWAQGRSGEADGGSARHEWSAATGLRVEQWMAPRGGGLALDARLVLPEMVRGQLSVETFAWERLDVMDSAATDHTVYQVLGVRRWLGRKSAAVFAGAHLMSFAVHARGFTPWIGFRLGQPGAGPSVVAEARLTGLGAVGWRGGGFDTGEVSVRMSGPRLGPVRLGGRGRVRSLAEVQRDATAAAGVETSFRGRPVFVGLGLEALEQSQTEIDDLMMESQTVRTSAAVLLQLEIDMALPRSLTE